MTTSDPKKTSKPSATRSKQKSTSGLTCIDLCQLIETAGKHGVEQLKFGDLEVKFNSMAGFEEVSIPDLIPNLANDTKIVDNENSQNDLVQGMNVDDLNELALTDPTEYERIKSGGELSA